MMRISWYQKLYFLKQSLWYHFKEHKVFYSIGFLCVLLGFITGVLNALKYAEVVSFSHISDATLISYLTGKTSIMGLFFSRFIGYIFLVTILFFVESVVWIFPIGYIILLYKAFTSALTIAFLIILSGVSGVLLAVFVLIPVLLLTMFAYVMLLSTCIKRMFICRRYGQSYCSNDAPSFLMQVVCWVSALLFLACVWELIFLPIVSVTFVVII